MSELRPGLRLHSAVDATEVVVVRAPRPDVTVTCGGVDMSPLPGTTAPAGAGGPGPGPGAEIGRRYAEEASGLEVLCTKGGEALLAVDGQPMLPKDAKPLPASD